MLYLVTLHDNLNINLVNSFKQYIVRFTPRLCWTLIIWKTRQNNNNVVKFFHINFDNIAAWKIFSTTDQSGAHQHSKSRSDGKSKGFSKIAQRWASHIYLDQPQGSGHHFGLRFENQNLLPLNVARIFYILPCFIFLHENSSPHFMHIF